MEPWPTTRPMTTNPAPDTVLIKDQAYPTAEARPPAA